MEQPEEIVLRLSALAQEVRLELMNLLAASGAEGLPAGVIAARLGVPPASLSFHLHQLVRARLLKQRRRSRHIIYTADQSQMAALLSYLESRWRSNPEPDIPETAGDSPGSVKGRTDLR